MNETKTLGDIIRDQEYAAAREFIRRKYPISELDARALTEFSLERNEYFRKIAEQAQQIVTAVVNTTVMPPLVVPNFPRHSQNQTAASGVEGAHEGTTVDKAELPREHQCVSANDCPLCDEYIPARSREPEKLNNAPISEWDQEIPRDNRFNGWVEPALAESSLSSPPPAEKKK